MRVDIPFEGLSNSLVSRRVGFQKAYNMLNATRRRGALEARSGFLQRWVRPSSPNAPTSGDQAYGFGYARYEDHEVMGYMILPHGNTYAHFYVHDLATGGTRHFGSDPNWTRRDASAWSFAQYDKYLYMVNEVDGVWRLDITSEDAEAFTQVDITLTSLVTATAGVSLDPDQYEVGSWSTMTPDASILDTTSYGNYCPDTSSITAAGIWKLDQTTGLDGRVDGMWWYTGVFGTAIDASEHRYWLFSIDIPESGDLKPFEDFVIVDEVGNSFEFWWTDDSTPTYGPPWTGWYRCAVSYTTFNQHPSIAFDTKAICIVDFDKFLKDYTSVPIDTVKAIAFGIPVGGANNGHMDLSPPKYGGVWLAKPSSSAYLKSDDRAPWGAEDVEYAITYYEPVGPSESAAAFKTLSKKDAAGLYTDGLIAGGAHVQITLPAPAMGFTATRLYRRRHSDSNKWYLIESVAVETDVTDSRVDWVDDPVSWAEIEIKDSGYSFGTGVRQELAPSCVAVWKTHMALGVGPEVYLSEAQDPSNYAQPLRNTATSGEVDTTIQDTSPSTKYVSSNQAEKVLALVPQDMLYAGTPDGVYVIVGDSAATSTPFRKLPGSRGPLNKEAMCPYKNGVLIAAQDGVFYIEASRAIAVSDDTTTYISQDLTLKDINESYKWLLNGSTGPVQVAVVGDDIWVIRGLFFLVRKDDERWERGAWSSQGLTTNDDGVGPGDGGGPGNDDPNWDDDPNDGDPDDGDDSPDDPPWVCYDNPADFSIVQTWSGSLSASPTAGIDAWTTGNGSNLEAGTGDMTVATITGSGTVTFEVTYTGSNPVKPTVVTVVVSGTVTADAEYLVSGGQARTSYSMAASASDGLGHSQVVVLDTGAHPYGGHKTVRSSGSRSFLLTLDGGSGTFTVSPSASASVSISNNPGDPNVYVLIKGAYSASIGDCPDPTTSLEGLE